LARLDNFLARLDNFPATDNQTIRDGNAPERPFRALVENPLMDEERRKSLVVRPSVAVGRPRGGAESVLSRIVSDALVSARSHVTSLSAARFRVGSYEFRDADYRQILLWANALEITPEKIIETFENTQRMYLSENDWISFEVEDGYRYLLSCGTTKYCL
jgi:hypothetical protein